MRRITDAVETTARDPDGRTVPIGFRKDEFLGTKYVILLS
jgi:hypothetical protein